MTEAEWLACIYPTRMIEGRRGWRRSTRNLRLLAVACCRRVWHLLSPALRNTVEVAERHADGEATDNELQAACPDFVLGGSIADNSTHFVAAPSRLFRSWVNQALSYAAWAVEQHGPRHDAELLAQCHIVRDIFGNPFRLVAFDFLWRRWNNGVVMALAQEMYDSRDFSKAPLLADMLEDAGCADPQLLDHLRGPGPHVRGCWAVDLILGKS